MDSSAAKDEKCCFDILFHVSRGFSSSIDRLEEPLRTTVCILYLTLRALDTIEDDTTVGKTIKLEALKNFSSNLDQLKWYCPSGIGHGLKLGWRDTNEHEIELMAKFEIVLRVFDRLSIENKQIIRETAEVMSEGMIKYLSHPIETMANYNEYCYYVAGVLGIGLTKLFQSNFVIDQIYTKHVEKLAISMGTFLQKANIIGDIYEDVTQPTARIFYPTEVWGKYVKSLQDLIDDNYLPQALDCLNFLIDDAFQHLPDSIEYLSMMPEKVFCFCAIPQALVVGVLEKMYNNPAVFNSSVKLLRTESAYIFENVKDMRSFLKITKPYLSNLSKRVIPSNLGDASTILESLKFVNEYEQKY